MSYFCVQASWFGKNGSLKFQGCRFVPYTFSETIRHRWSQAGSKYWFPPGFGGLIQRQIYNPQIGLSSRIRLSSGLVWGLHVSTVPTIYWHGGKRTHVCIYYSHLLQMKFVHVVYTVANEVCTDSTYRFNHYPSLVVYCRIISIESQTTIHQDFRQWYL